MINICVVGTGYVGLVVGTCLLTLGSALCVDKDHDKIDGLHKGKLPIYEPGLAPILTRNVREERLFFTVDGPSAIQQAEVIFIAVGTPGQEDGCRHIGRVGGGRFDWSQHASTVSRGHQKHRPGRDDRQSAHGFGNHANYEFDVVSNQNFWEAAIKDFTHPDRIVVGCKTTFAREAMEKLYSSLVRTGRPIFFMTIAGRTDEHAANAMLATKISFMNELSRL